MSADNYIGVRPFGNRFSIEHGSMSCLDEDCMYQGGITDTADTREEALVKAHDHLKQEYIVEYGVIELDAVRTIPCGHCWVCINMRGPREAEV